MEMRNEDSQDLNPTTRSILYNLRKTRNFDVLDIAIYGTEDLIFMFQDRFVKLREEFKKLRDDVANVLSMGDEEYFALLNEAKSKSNLEREEKIKNIILAGLSNDSPISREDLIKKVRDLCKCSRKIAVERIRNTVRVNT